MKEFKNVSELNEDELVTEINRMTKISKERELTEEEAEYRQLLRVRFIENFKAGFHQQLKSVKVVDENGNDITPEKLKNEKKN